MKKVWMSVLMNMSGVNGEEYKLLSIRKDIVEDSAEKGGTDEMKAMLRERIVEELFNNDTDSFFEGMGLTDEMVDNCINELATGRDSNILGENFWWKEEDVILSLTDDEPEKKWVVTQESNVDGEIHFNVLVCDSKEIALRKMAEEIEWIRTESSHFRGFDQEGEDFEIEQTEHRFFIMDDSDDYYEEIMVYEKEIIKS